MRNVFTYYVLLVALLLGISRDVRGEDTSSTFEALPPAPRTDYEQQIIDAYKRTNRAVVNVTTRFEQMDLFGPVSGEGTGSGVIIDAQKGLVITNLHVISGQGEGVTREIVVTLADGNNYKAKRIGADPDNDLALLRLLQIPPGLTAIELGDSGSLEVGQRVIAIGNPFGLNRTLTQGIVSSLGRTIRGADGRIIPDVIQTDAAINPGNSGGALLDTRGRLIGINTAILSPAGQSAGIGFAVPVNTVRTTVPQLIRFGKVRRPHIGIAVADTEVGPVILYSEPQSPAEEAGIIGARRLIRRGLLIGAVTDVERADFIIEVNGVKVLSREEVMTELRKLYDEKPVTLKLRRGLRQGAVRTVEVTPVIQ